MPGTTALTWSDNGIDTQKIQYFSVYPSEWYIYEWTGIGRLGMKITHGNVSDAWLGKGVYVWREVYTINETSGEKSFNYTSNWGFWNNSVQAYYGGPIPVEDDGHVSSEVFNAVSTYYQWAMSYTEFEHNHSDFAQLSFSFWNESYNNNYFRVSYSNNGIPISRETWLDNNILISSPAQKPPQFNITTKDGKLDVNSTALKLKVDIFDVDNNNDGIIDNEYEYRISTSSGWTEWMSISSTINYDLGAVSSGFYNITVEVKNMYGVTQGQITIHYIAPITPDVDNSIPSYSPLFLLAILFISIMVLSLKNRIKS
jgi:hypothetical protein